MEKQEPIDTIIKRKLNVVKKDPTHARISELVLLVQKFYDISYIEFLNTNDLKSICEKIENIISQKDISYNSNNLEINNQKDKNHEDEKNKIDKIKSKIKKMLPYNIYKKVIIDEIVENNDSKFDLNKDENDDNSSLDIIEQDDNDIIENEINESEDEGYSLYSNESDNDSEFSD